MFLHRLTRSSSRTRIHSFLVGALLLAACTSVLPGCAGSKPAETPQGPEATAPLPPAAQQTKDDQILKQAADEKK
jgi:hypothetical protein